MLLCTTCSDFHCLLSTSLWRHKPFFAERSGASLRSTKKVKKQQEVSDFIIELYGRVPYSSMDLNQDYQIIMMIVQKMKFYAFIFPFLCLQINFYFTLQVAVEELLTYTLSELGHVTLCMSPIDVFCMGYRHLCDVTKVHTLWRHNTFILWDMSMAEAKAGGLDFEFSWIHWKWNFIAGILTPSSWPWGTDIILTAHSDRIDYRDCVKQQ